MKNGIAVEICVGSVESALAAERGGADRAELCDNLVEGGTTPSAGAIGAARKLLSIGLQVMIRPRGGDFLYSDVEFEIMRLDVDMAKKLGADGVVFGLLNSDGTVDAERTAELVERARPLSVTFHRAFDVCRDPFEALETLISSGVDRILTSGQQPNAEAGADLMADLVKAAGERVIILGCGELSADNIARVVARTGVREVHFTGFVENESEMTYRNEKVPMGGSAPPSEYSWPVTGADKVRQVISML